MKASTTTVKIGHFEFEGLYSEDGQFGISVTQLNDILQFSVTQNYASRDLKRLLPEALSVTPKWVCELNSKAVNVLLLNELELVIFELSMAGNVVAAEMARELIGHSFVQYFSDAFGVKFELLERQEWKERRLAGMAVRRTLTDATQLFCDTEDVSDSYKKFIYSNLSDAINKGVFGKTAKQLCVERNVKKADLRDSHSEEELKSIAAIENLAMKLIDNKGFEPLSAVKEAVRLLT